MAWVYSLLVHNQKENNPCSGVVPPLGNGRARKKDEVIIENAHVIGTGGTAVMFVSWATQMYCFPLLYYPTMHLP